MTLLPGSTSASRLVSASAALLGLVFVVVSIHLRAVVDDPVVRRRAEIMLGLLATTFAASAALVIPGQSREALGIELMPVALVYISLSTLATVGVLSAMLAIWMLFLGLGFRAAGGLTGSASRCGRGTGLEPVGLDADHYPRRCSRFRSRRKVD